MNSSQPEHEVNISKSPATVNRRFDPFNYNPVETADTDDPVLMGIMAEILSEELAGDEIKVPFLEFPTKEQVGSPRRNKFWKDLERAINPNLFTGEISPVTENSAE